MLVYWVENFCRDILKNRLVNLFKHSFALLFDSNWFDGLIWNNYIFIKTFFFFLAKNSNRKKFETRYVVYYEGNLAAIRTWFIGIEFEKLDKLGKMFYSFFRAINDGINFVLKEKKTECVIWSRYFICFQSIYSKLSFGR